MRSYKTICPMCHNDNFYVTPHNGVGFCFNCRHYERDGNAPYATIRKRSDNIPAIRQFYTEISAYYHSCLDTKTRDFLYVRGYTDATIQTLRIGYIPSGTHPMYRNPIAREAGLTDKRYNAFLGNRIAFPYFKDAKAVTDIRARTLDSYEELKYKSPFNDAYYRGAIYPYNYQIVRKAQRILVTEGEIKAGIATQAQFATIGIPGILAWRRGFTQEDDQEYIIVFDNEIKPNVQRDVIFAIRRISQYIINPKVAVLPLMDITKSEVDTFINRYGSTMFKSIIDNALDYDVWDSLQLF